MGMLCLWGDHPVEHLLISLAIGYVAGLEGVVNSVRRGFLVYTAGSLTAVALLAYRDTGLLQLEPSGGLRLLINRIPRRPPSAQRA